MRQLTIRIVNLILIIGAIFYYQNTVKIRAEEVELYESMVQKAQDLQEEYDRQIAAADKKVAEEEYLKKIQYGNGTFEGAGTGFGGDIVLQIIVDEYQIKEVTILSASGEDKAYYEQAAAVLPNEILQAQGIEKVDTVAGATFSSKGILSAAEQALVLAKQARPTDEDLLILWEENAEKKEEGGEA